VNVHLREQGAVDGRCAVAAANVRRLLKPPLPTVTVLPELCVSRGWVFSAVHLESIDTHIHVDRRGLVFVPSKIAESPEPGVVSLSVLGVLQLLSAPPPSQCSGPNLADFEPLDLGNVRPLGLRRVCFFLLRSGPSTCFSPAWLHS